METETRYYKSPEHLIEEYGIRFSEIYNDILDDKRMCEEERIAMLHTMVMGVISQYTNENYAAARAIIGSLDLLEVDEVRS